MAACGVNVPPATHPTRRRVDLAFPAADERACWRSAASSTARTPPASSPATRRGAARRLGWMSLALVTFGRPCAPPARRLARLRLVSVVVVDDGFDFKVLLVDGGSVVRVPPPRAGLCQRSSRRSCCCRCSKPRYLLRCRISSTSRSDPPFVVYPLIQGTPLVDEDPDGVRAFLESLHRTCETDVLPPTRLDRLVHRAVREVRGARVSAARFGRPLARAGALRGGRRR